MAADYTSTGNRVLTAGIADGSVPVVDSGRRRANNPSTRHRDPKTNRSQNVEVRMSDWSKRALLVCVVISGTQIVAACGSKRLSREEASGLLSSAPPFTTEAIVQTVGLDRGRCIMRQFDPDAAENRRYQQVAATVQRLGWFTIRRRPATSQDCGFFSGMSDVILLSLTDAGRKEESAWPSRPVNDLDHEYGGRSYAWNLPLKRRTFVAVTGISDPAPSTGEVQVEFQWQITWPLGGSPDDQRGVATFRKYDTGWRIEKFEGIS